MSADRPAALPPGSVLAQRNRTTPAPAAPGTRRDGAHDLVVLIEFRWRVSVGIQPVIYLDRQRLH